MRPAGLPYKEDGYVSKEEPLSGRTGECAQHLRKHAAEGTTGSLLSKSKIGNVKSGRTGTDCQCK
jgi:hypothetical protein